MASSKKHASEGEKELRCHVVEVGKEGCECDSGGSKQTNTHSSLFSQTSLDTLSHAGRKSGPGGTFTANAVWLRLTRECEELPFL